MKRALEEQINRSMRCNLVIRGVPESKDEKEVEKMMTQLIHDNLECEENEDLKIDVAHRFGRRNPEKPRPIVVKFKDRSSKKKVKRKSMVRDSHLFKKGIYLNEQFSTNVENY